MEARFQEKWATVFRPEARAASAVTPTAVILTPTAVILGLVPRICSRRRIPGGRWWILATRARMTERDEGANGGALPGKVDTGFPSGSARNQSASRKSGHRFSVRKRSCLRRHRHRRHPHPHRRHPRACPEDLQSAPHPRRALVDPRHKGEDDGARRGCEWRRASRKNGHRFSVRKREARLMLPGKWTRFPSGSAPASAVTVTSHRRHPHPHRRHPRACPEDLQSAPHPRRALVDPRHKGEDDGARRGCDWRRASRKSGYRFSVRKRVKSERWRGFALP